ncbi:class I SAM-dependent methyltransferase [Aristaeella hokkaidonensis]|uniref:Methyltransferase domain-containing protein n=1 Tax=Aristaeella hokkaidonensis TaxID=3046382 RepID=A0AC61N290_9FIRM|nr:methyltransferase domain-containing protein [Aristaeella hokkaidonensis]QUC67709.1 methyltransferase domain-containing protein [Aristaeella hokkaidonensis]SNT92758.1 Methyltransferase domain-containing protein [Aristaeella hokkaidonensis]
MDYSTKISERMWNLPDKGELESKREQTFIDDIVQKAHIERELFSHLDGIQTVFDGGAGCGRFSILLARQGLQVTHFDISQAMIDKARELAEKAGVLDHITFVKGALEDLSAYTDRSFDLVMSFDAPISYTWPNQEQTIRELVRIAKKRIMFSVSSRLGALPYLANPLQKNQFILDKNSSDSWVQWCLNSRQQMIDGFTFREENLLKTLDTGLLCDVEETKEAYDRGETPWCITYHFMPDELKQILENCGVKDVALAGPGAFARTIPNEILVKIMNDPEQKKDFLDFCHHYDSNPYVCGMGKDNLFARGEIG